MQDISVFVLFRIALKRIWVLILAFVIVAAAVFSYCEFIAVPVYVASSSIIVTNGAVISSESDVNSQKVLGSDIQASLLLADSVVDMLKTPDIYMYLSRKIGGDIKHKDLMARTSVKRRGEETLFIDISYTDNDPQQAIKVANLFASASCDYVAEFISKANPKIVSSADKASLVFPKTLRSTILAGAAAAFVVYAVFVLLEIFNNTVKGEEDFAQRYNVPLLGSVPDFEEARKARSRKKGDYY